MSDTDQEPTGEQNSIQHLQLQSSPDSLFPPIQDAEPSSPRLEMWENIRRDEEPYRMPRRPTTASQPREQIEEESESGQVSSENVDEHEGISRAARAFTMS